MKGQFQSTEVMQIRFPPFINKLTGAELTGTDICTVVVRKPNATTSTFTNLTSPAVTFDATVGMWVLDIPVGSYVQGEWRIRATSNATDTIPQRRVLHWGDYVEEIDNGVDAANAALLGTMSTQITAIEANSVIARKILTGRWKIDVDANKLFMYDENNVAILYTFDLKDENGLATATRIFERVRV